jgi:ligand-binding sensor domain-containing protein
VNRLALAVLALVTAPAAVASAAPGHRVLANTAHVEDLLIVDSQEGGPVVYTATRGGIELYRLSDGRRLRHYTSADGLADMHIRELSMSGGVVEARSREHLCVQIGARFACSKERALANPRPRLAGRKGGARMTKKVHHRGRALVATAGAGLWLDDRRLTPRGQICSNHMMAITAYRGRTYFGSFDDGLCSSADGMLFMRHQGPFRMINDLEATPHGLFVASGEGLYKTVDGMRFEKIEFVSQRGVNGLAFDGRSLWVTTPGALWRVRVKGGPRNMQYWTPGGSRSLQAVAARGRQVWIATEDRGLVKKTRKGFEVYDRAYGLPSSWTLDVTIDRRGRVYGATLRDGVVAIDRKGKISRVGKQPDPWTLFVAAIAGKLTVGTQGGAIIIGKSDSRTDFGLPHPNVHVIARSQGSLFVGTEGGTVMMQGS